MEQGPACAVSDSEDRGRRLDVHPLASYITDLFSPLTWASTQAWVSLLVGLSRAMLDKKSNENWDAAEGCLAVGYLNAAASRYYYALFQSVFYHAVALGRMKLDASDEERRRRHGEASTWVGEKAGRVSRQTYQTMRGMREKADYAPEGVSGESLRAVLDEANDLRKMFLVLGEKANADHR